MSDLDSVSSSRMSPRGPLVAVGVALIGLIGVACLKAAEPQAAESKAAPTPEQKAIQATAEAFAKAFNSGDAKAVAALWTADGSLIDEEGAVFKGRKAIEDVYAVFFKEYPGARIEILVGPVEFPTPTTAVEDGVSQVALKDASSGGASRYTAVHVLEDSKWLMASVRESSVTPATGYARMKDIQWLVGDWESKSETATVRSNIRWIANKCFVQRDYTASENGEVTSSGTQIIGWDPRLDQVRSWSFDSSGGHGNGLWTPTPEGWQVESVGVLADGTPTSSLDYVIRVPGDDGVLGWRSMNRKVGMVPLPDTREVVLDRVPQKQ